MGPEMKAEDGAVVGSKSRGPAVVPLITLSRKESWCGDFEEKRPLLSSLLGREEENVCAEKPNT